MGDAGRGSNAFTGAVDIVLSLRRSEGSGHPNLRVLQSLSRLDETPAERFVELTDTWYQQRRGPAAVTERAELAILHGASNNIGDRQDGRRVHDHGGYEALGRGTAEH